MTRRGVRPGTPLDQAGADTLMSAKPRIAYFAGSNATIHSIPPLVTSNKARAKYGLAPLTNPDGTPARFDVLRPQRLARPAVVYVEQFSAHPLEADAAELYGPPDGYLDATANFHKERQSPGDKAGVRSRAAPGRWPLSAAVHGASGRRPRLGCRRRAGRSRPRTRAGNRSSRTARGRRGDRSARHRRARHRQSHLRVCRGRLLPRPAGRPATRRACRPAGAPISARATFRAETLGKDFFPYRPPHLGQHPPRPGLARDHQRRAGRARRAASMPARSGRKAVRASKRRSTGSTCCSTRRCRCAATRPSVRTGMISNDGPKNLVDSVDFITSRVWADEDGQEPRRAGADPGAADFRGARSAEGRRAARRLCRDRRPRRHPGRFRFRRDRRSSPMCRRRGTPIDLMSTCRGCRPRSSACARRGGRADAGDRRRSKAARASSWTAPSPRSRSSRMATTSPTITTAASRARSTCWPCSTHKLRRAPLAGFVLEGLSPYGTTTSRAAHQAMLRAVCSGMPVARVGRGNNEGFTQAVDPFIGGAQSHLDQGAPAADGLPDEFRQPAARGQPGTADQGGARRDPRKLVAYQAVFDTH